MSQPQSRELDPILVAEDNLDDAMLLRMVFQRARILNPIKVVQDGELAIQYIRGEGAFSDRKSHPYPILFLLDLKMPRKGGMDVLRWLGENPSRTPLPVVVTAGRSEMREVNCAYSLGARSFLVKPLSWLDVMELLSCFRELRLAAHGENYALEPVQTTPAKPISQRPTLYGYKPQPLDTSRLKLTDDILRLTELLAENNHEVWARDRMVQGWTYGPKRNDDKKEHPCLVPYRDLPESEKLVDRNVALETIKTIFSFGLPYPVLDKATDSVRAEVIEKSVEVLRKENLTAEELRGVWEEHNAVVWAQAVDLYRHALAAALRFSEAFLACDIAAEGLKKFHNDLHLRLMQALALARTGSAKGAGDILEDLRSSGDQDVETLAVLARTYKDFWAFAIDTAAKRRHLKLSFELYHEAYRRSGDYSLGVNAAATGMLYGEKETACQIAGEVQQVCHTLLSKPDRHADEKYFLQVALAESLLIQGDLLAAEQAYQTAAGFAGQNWRALNRTRTEARFLLERAGRSSSQLDACFKLPRIVVCSGHMLDKPERRQMRFPFGLESRVRDQIRHKLAQLDARIGFSSLACGTDMLFAETILERGGEIHIILPCNRQQFRAASVDIIPGAKLGERFDEILARAASVTILDEVCAGRDPGIFEYCNRIMIGQSLLQGRLLGLDVIPLAVWDGQSSDGPGGTENFVGFWKTQQTPVEIISLKRILDDIASEDTFVRQRQSSETVAVSPEQPAEVSPQIIKAVVFADMLGHARLSQQQLPTFIQHFLMEVSCLLNSLPKPPIVRNTWGDTIYCVFDEVSEAASFAMALQELSRRTDWTSLGLPGNLSARITLHAGPVYPCVDPVSEKTTFLGPHVNRAMRIEPIVEEGQIYTTEAFAALSESRAIKEYVCDYVGQKQLPKRYGTIPVYMVRRAASH